MPQLPSGRHVSICSAPLNAFIVEMWSRGNPTDLLVIEQIGHLYRYIDVQELVPGEGELELDRGSDVAPSGLVAQSTGYTLATRSDLMSTWSLEDCLEFEAFMWSPRVTAYLEEALALVMEHKEAMRTHGSYWQRFHAGCWKMGVHHLQEDLTREW